MCGLLPESWLIRHIECIKRDCLYLPFSMSSPTDGRIQCHTIEPGDGTIVRTITFPSLPQIEQYLLSQVLMVFQGETKRATHAVYGRCVPFYQFYERVLFHRVDYSTPLLNARGGNLSHHGLIFYYQSTADGPVAEHALNGLALRDGDGEGVLLAVGPRTHVKVDGLRGGARAPAAA